MPLFFKNWSFQHSLTLFLASKILPLQFLPYIWSVFDLWSWNWSSFAFLSTCWTYLQSKLRLEKCFLDFLDSFRSLIFSLKRHSYIMNVFMRSFQWPVASPHFSLIWEVKKVSPDFLLEPPFGLKNRLLLRLLLLMRVLNGLAYHWWLYLFSDIKVMV